MNPEGLLTPSMIQFGETLPDEQHLTTYELSYPVHKHTGDLNVDLAPIHWFVSHSWRGDRWKKYFAIAFMLQAYKAACIASLACVIGACFFTSRYEWSGLWLDDMLDFLPIGCALTGGMICIFFVLLLFSHHLDQSNKTFFFDRCCIHQRNGALKRDGILHLGQFLQFSKRVLVLWDPSYFDRMWCLFELATFAKIKASQQAGITKQGENGSVRTTIVQNHDIIAQVVDNVDVMPVHFSYHRVISNLTILFLCILVIFVDWIQRSFSIQSQALRIATASLIFVVHPAVAGRVARHERQVMRRCEEELKTFDIASAHASVESDRELVMEHVREQWGSTDAFNQFIRQDLLDHLRAEGTLSCLSSMLSLKGIATQVLPGFLLCIGALVSTLILPIGWSLYTAFQPNEVPVELELLTNQVPI